MMLCAPCQHSWHGLGAITLVPVGMERQRKGTKTVNIRVTNMITATLPIAFKNWSTAASTVAADFMVLLNRAGMSTSCKR